MSRTSGMRWLHAAMSDVSPARIVADADVLAADLFVDGAARDALDHVRSHSWVELVASEALLADAETVLSELGDEDLATNWRARIESLATLVEHPRGDHPALAAAYHGDAAHVLTYDEQLRSARTGMELKERVDVSVKEPEAFARLFDAERLYPTVVGGEYPGPDQDPRA
jgi:predicted nucleic acid-binding protein